MNNLSARIYNFIEKQVVHLTHEEAAKMGIKLPPSKIKPPSSGIKPPSSKVSKPKDVITPTKPTKGRQTDKVSDIAGEVGHQLTPLGPYQSPSDISRDIRESRRVGGKVESFLNPKKPKENV